MIAQSLFVSHVAGAGVSRERGFVWNRGGGSHAFDGDGQSDLAEFFSGTDPKDGASLLKLTAGAGDAQGVTITWAAVTGKRYRVQYRESVTDPRWFDLAGDVTATGGEASKTDTTAASSSKRFYRIVLLP